MNPIKLILIALVLVVCESAKKCPPGHYIVKAGVCRPCPTGTFQARANKRGCRPCPPNKIAAKKGSTKCTACPAFSKPSFFKHKCICRDGLVEENGECVSCQPGTFFQKVDGDRRCSNCPRGYFQPRRGQRKCLACPRGTFSKADRISCVKCGKGEAFTIFKDKCEKCKPGFTHSPDRGCEICRRNTFKKKAGAGPCLLCPPGKHSLPGARKCSKCPKGTVLFKNGKCGSCPAGSFFDQNALRCIKCFFNSFTTKRNVRTDCYFCGDKEFALRGATKCVRCPNRKFLMKDGKCRSCPPGNEFSKNRLMCRKCAVNSYTRGERNSCAACPAKTYAFPGSTTCFACPKDKALILATKKCEKCPAGRFYIRFEGACRLCSDGTVKKNPGLGDCVQCPPGLTSNNKHTKCVPVKS